MSNKYILEIMNEYENLRNDDINQQQNRQKEIYLKFPRVKEIDDKINKIGIEIATSVFKNVDVEKFIESKKKGIIDLKIEKAEILSLNKFPLDYLDVKYKCNKCKDTGYIGPNKCICFKQKLIEKLYQQSNLKDILNKENFDNFNFGFYSQESYMQGISPRQNIENIYRYVVNYVETFDSEDKSLYFYGNPGLGKTFLANCISKSILDRGKTVIYLTSPGFIDLMRSIRFNDSSSKDEQENMLENIMNCDLLVIDDFGTESVNSFSYSEIFNVINTRMLKNKKMIMSTNYDVEDLLENYPERITSRIFGNFVIFKFLGEDIRLKYKSK